MSPSTQFVEKLLQSRIARLFSETEQADLFVRADAVTSVIPLHTTFAFPSPGSFLFVYTPC